MGEALLYKDADTINVTVPTGGYTSGQVLQLPDGRAAYVEGLRSLDAGEQASLQVRGQVTLPKTANLNILKGCKVWFDRSANTATPLRAEAGGDFYLGIALYDSLAAAATVTVMLNEEPVPTIDLLRDVSDTVLVKTAGTPSLSMLPGCARMQFSNTAEAQKVDMLSRHSLPIDIPFIAEFEVNIVDSGDAAAAAVDINIGLANNTHASDGDAITESIFMHVDGADTNGAVNINMESDDGTTEVAATDTTKDFAAGTPFTFWIDGRDLTDIQVYVEAVNVLPASVFKLNAATGPLKILAHMEKGANDTLADVRINRAIVRAMDVE